MVKTVGSLVEFEAELKSAGEKLIVVDFSATWCGPCKMIKPFFHVHRDRPVALPQEVGYREETMFIFLYTVNVLLQLPSGGHVTPDESLCDKYGDVVFIEIDVDDAQDVASHCDVKCMPTFQFYKNGKKVQEFSGANKEKLEETIKSLV